MTADEWRAYHVSVTRLCRCVDCGWEARLPMWAGEVNGLAEPIPLSRPGRQRADGGPGVAACPRCQGEAEGAPARLLTGMGTIRLAGCRLVRTEREETPDGARLTHTWTAAEATISTGTDEGEGEG